MVFLDVDGVMCDFVGSAIRLHGRDASEVLATYPAGERDVAKVLGISNCAFWRKIDEAGEDWWATLPLYPWAERLLQVVQGHDEFVFATSPSLHQCSAAGKVRWFQTNFGSDFRGYMLGEHKHLFAKPGAILIDDSERNCERFELAGGRAILFPAPWNCLGAAVDPVARVSERVVSFDDKGGVMRANDIKAARSMACALLHTQVHSDEAWVYLTGEDWLQWFKSNQRIPPSLQVHHIFGRGTEDHETRTNMIVVSAVSHAWGHDRCPNEFRLACLYAKFQKRTYWEGLTETGSVLAHSVAPEMVSEFDPRTLSKLAGVPLADWLEVQGQKVDGQYRVYAEEMIRWLRTTG